jgi:mono/diheme cytochrome c family protein
MAARRPHPAGAASVLLTLLLPAGQAMTATPAVAHTSVQRPAPPAAGSPVAIWAGACTYCHDRGIAPSIFGRDLTVAAIAATVRNGRGAMPAFHPSEIDDAALLRLAQWVSQQPAPATVGP